MVHDDTELIISPADPSKYLNDETSAGDSEFLSKSQKKRIRKKAREAQKGKQNAPRGGPQLYA